jgi:hypothetical protein
MLDRYSYGIDDGHSFNRAYMTWRMLWQSQLSEGIVTEGLPDALWTVNHGYDLDQGGLMRKVRDYDAELKALGDKARTLKAKRIEQLGQLVTATGADALDAETLAGVLIDAIGSKDANAKEAWRTKGAAFFQRRGRKGGGAAAIDGSGAATDPGGDAASGSGGTA